MACYFLFYPPSSFSTRFTVNWYNSVLTFTSRAISRSISIIRFFKASNSAEDVVVDDEADVVAAAAGCWGRPFVFGRVATVFSSSSSRRRFLPLVNA